MALVFFLLHLTACHSISILKRDKRQFTVWKKKTKNTWTHSLSTELLSEMEICTLPNTESTVYINLCCSTRLQQRACNYYLSFSFSSCASTCINNSDAMNKSCLETRNFWLVCVEISFISEPSFYVSLNSCS